jgi:P-type Ca2+ transporter type 2A
MSLSILVVIEMFNAMNSLSETESLLTLPFWTNPFLVGAIILSILLHFTILYVPLLSVSVITTFPSPRSLEWFAQQLFVTAPLNWDEWKAVLIISFPVVVLDEVLKFLSVTFIDPPTKLRLKKD